jgi:hypothetical protein
LRIFLIAFIAGDPFDALRFDVAGVISDRPRIPGAVSKTQATPKPLDRWTPGSLGHPQVCSWPRRASLLFCAILKWL